MVMSRVEQRKEKRMGQNLPHGGGGYGVHESKKEVVSREGSNGAQTVRFGDQKGVGGRKTSERVLSERNNKDGVALLDGPCDRVSVQLENKVGSNGKEGSIQNSKGKGKKALVYPLRELKEVVRRRKKRDRAVPLAWVIAKRRKLLGKNDEARRGENPALLRRIQEIHVHCAKDVGWRRNGPPPTKRKGKRGEVGKKKVFVGSIRTGGKEGQIRRLRDAFSKGEIAILKRYSQQAGR